MAPELVYGAGMTTDRRLKIIHQLAIRHEMEVEELSRLLHVSPSTIRRELSVMEKDGLLVRTHGAAHLRLPIDYDPPYASRAANQLHEKRAIALAATQLVTPGMLLALVGGTTCTALARMLRSLDDLTIVTSAINVALELQGQPNKRVIVTGGTLNRNSYELVGSQAIGSLENVHCEMAFLGASGMSPEYGLSMSDEPEAAVGRALIASADRAVVLADHTKLGKRGLVRVCPLEQLSLLITDARAAPEQLASLRRAGLEVIVAEAPVVDIVARGMASRGAMEVLAEGRSEP
jgi:DeoR/GlpR family transcriptional regulator of sugar metabolism